MKQDLREIPARPLRRTRRQPCGITAAICSGPEAHHEADKRYVAGIALGVFYTAFGATLAVLFAALALLGAIMNGLSAAMAHASGDP